MNASERRAEIIRILMAKRRETMCELADELGVSDRTIRSDINILTIDYPLETIRGNGGCVKLAEWYKPKKRLLNQEQIRVLNEIVPTVNTYQADVLEGILQAYS